MIAFSTLLTQVRGCTLCKESLPNDPRPVIQLHQNAKILIAGQAPGIIVHNSGVPFDDPSGNRLREWLGVSRKQFYDPEKFAILPMGFCFPGSGKSGDLPPRPECEIAWRNKILKYLNDIEMTIVLGKYAHLHHFGQSNLNVTELVRSWKSYWPDMIPLPHPSPRNNIWLRKNPWFETEVLPALQERVSDILKV